MSTFAWIDHSEKQRRQILEAIDLFREKDTRDELGLAGIRDTFTDTPCSVLSARSTCASIRLENDRSGGLRDAGRMRGRK
jgi:hypothetical protein